MELICNFLFFLESGATPVYPEPLAGMKVAPSGEWLTDNSGHNKAIWVFPRAVFLGDLFVANIVIWVIIFGTQ